jgi:hypothetical protein
MYAPLRERGGREGGDGDTGADDMWSPISKRILYPGIFDSGCATQHILMVEKIMAFIVFSS